MTRGDLIWWKRSGYGYKSRIPAVFKELSASGKRAYISLTSEDGYKYSMYVDPKRLEPRSQPDAAVKSESSTNDGEANGK